MFYTESGMSESAYQAYNGQRPARLLFLCDHASNAVPPELDLLGLSETDFARHIAYDIGAAELTHAVKEVESQSFRAFESYFIATVLYLGISLLIMALGAWIDRRASLVHGR